MLLQCGYQLVGNSGGVASGRLLYSICVARLALVSARSLSPGARLLDWLLVWNQSGLAQLNTQSRRGIQHSTRSEPSQPQSGILVMTVVGRFATTK